MRNCIMLLEYMKLLASPYFCFDWLHHKNSTAFEMNFNPLSFKKIFSERYSSQAKKHVSVQNKYLLQTNIYFKINSSRTLSYMQRFHICWIWVQICGKLYFKQGLEMIWRCCMFFSLLLFSFQQCYKQNDFLAQKSNFNYFAKYLQGKFDKT